MGAGMSVETGLPTWKDFLSKEAGSGALAETVVSLIHRGEFEEAPLGYGKRARKRGLRPSPHSLPALLKTRGYATSLIGKWQLGFRPALGPNVHGFDEFWGFLSGGIDFYSHSWRDGTV